MEGLAGAAEAIEAEFLTDWVEILDNNRASAGTLDRATRTVTLTEGAMRYEGPASVTASASHRETDGPAPADSDETLFRIRRCEDDVLRVGQIVRLRGVGHGREMWSEFEITRIPARSHKMTTQFLARRWTRKPTAGA